MERRIPTRSVGVFIAIALTTVAVLILNFSKGAGVFSRRYQIYVEAMNVGGMKKGAPVSVSGVPVGHVEDISLTEDGLRVLLDCRINIRFKVYSNSVFEIEQSGFLGDQFVAIIPSTNSVAGQGVLPDGATVRARAPFNLQEAARQAVSLMARLEVAADRLDGAVARVDTNLLSHANLATVTNTLANLERVSRRADEAVLDVQALVRTNSPAVQQALSNLNAFTLTLSTVATNLDTLVLTNQDTVRATLDNFRQTSVDLREVAAGVREGRGLVGELVRGDKLSGKVDQILTDVGILSSNLSRNGLLWKPRKTTPLTNNTRYSGRGVGR